jgi:hypothetical protein
VEVWFGLQMAGLKLHGWPGMERGDVRRKEWLFSQMKGYRNDNNSFNAR